MTGFFSWARGSSFLNESMAACRRIWRSKRETALVLMKEKRCVARAGRRDSEKLAGTHQVVLDDGAHRQAGQKRERTDQHDGADEQHDEGEALDLERAGTGGDEFLRRQVAGERED